MSDKAVDLVIKEMVQRTVRYDRTGQQLDLTVVMLGL